jgi:hypothetical protein
MDRSPQWAKNAANAAKKRAMKRTKLLGPMSGMFDIRNNGRVTNYTQRNREGREYKIFKGINWARVPEQISGPPMPSAWLPESGYGAERERQRPYYTMEPPEQEFGVYNAETGETAYGGSRKTRSRKTRRSRNRKTRRNSRR